MTVKEANSGGGPARKAVGGAACLLAAAALLLASCEDSDPTAPEDSTMAVSADPQTAVASQPVKITATLRSSNGTRLPDQEIIFSTTQGSLYNPAAEEAVLSDDNGQARTTLRSNITATVTARSGTISDDTTVTITKCQLSGLTLNLETTEISVCNTDVEITVTALDTDGNGCASLTVIVQSGPSTQASKELTGSITPQQGITDANGVFTTNFTPGNECGTECTSEECAADFTAEDESGSIRSILATLKKIVPQP